ncbi:MAG: hypothetical protein L0L22_14070 [Staphylococcus equorum]|nr:hypothetical protein [Tetragenococcus koreensis]MDN6572110.1 hypothetical protein [Staphylococcus equorum]
MQRDIVSDAHLTNEQVSECIKIFEQKFIPPTDKVVFPIPNVINYLDAVNEIIQVNITKPAIINFEIEEKTNWAKEELKLHTQSDRNDPVCAFCGGELSDERLEQLNSFLMKR